jgi:5-formyltetrahydrofolate cyclo-ligase
MSDPQPTPTAKEALRKLMRARIRTDIIQRGAVSLSIATQIRRHPGWASAATVALFAPLPEEPDLLCLMGDAAKRFVFPCIQSSQLAWRTANNPESLQPTPHPQSRLKEPTHGEWVDSDSLDLVLVPGLAFTLCGRRLGRGGGYYDRALSVLPLRAISLGVCFSFQIVESIPVEAHDQPVRAVLHA